MMMTLLLAFAFAAQLQSLTPPLRLRLRRRLPRCSRAPVC